MEYRGRVFLELVTNIKSQPDTRIKDLSQEVTSVEVTQEERGPLPTPISGHKLNVVMGA